MVIKVSNPEALKNKLATRQLMLYGIGSMGTEISKWLDSQDIDYIIVDRNAEEKRSFFKKSIITPDILFNKYKEANVIVSSNLYYDEIRNNLLQNGFSDEQIISYANFVPEEIFWTDLEDNIDWDLMKPSVEIIAGLIDKNTNSVIDYGAGQMYLKKLINSNITYYPVDYFKRFPETIVCDLNEGVFPDITTDTAVLNGVLEFLTTAAELLKYVCKKTKHRIILSYMTIDKYSNKDSRRASGYVSDLSEKDILNVLGENGFALVKSTSDPIDKTDTIYLFEKSDIK